MNNETEVNPFKKIVQDVKDGIIGDNGAIYNEEVCERVGMPEYIAGVKAIIEADAEFRSFIINYLLGEDW